RGSAASRNPRMRGWQPSLREPPRRAGERAQEIHTMKANRPFLYMLLAGVVLVGGSCSEPPLGVGSAPPASSKDVWGLGQVVPGLLSCTPQPYDSVTQTVGAAGGTISVGA